MRIPSVAERVQQWANWKKSSEPHPGLNGDNDERPLRDELFSNEQLQSHARSLAATHQLTKGRSRDRLILRLKENERALIATYKIVTAAVERKRRIPPASDWLLDNFYLIEEQIRTARQHLPRSFSRQLPSLAIHDPQSSARIYSLALELISHSDGRVDESNLREFIAAYQSLVPLQLGELWALPIMLRIGLIENLRRIATRIAVGRRHQDLADDWAERMIQAVATRPTDLVLVLADMIRANPPLSGAFVTELVRHLQGQSPHFAFANGWLEQRLSGIGTTTERLVLAEGQEQSTDQVSMSNSVASLRFLGSYDWRDFVEEQSDAEAVLRTDPSGHYPKMDFATRDQYRHVVEQISRHGRLTEAEVARVAIQKGQTARDENGPERARHVGYYLLDRGLRELERAAGLSQTLTMRLSRMGRRFPLVLYGGSVLGLTGLMTVVFGILLTWLGVSPAGKFLLLLPAACIAFSHVAIGVCNWFANLLVSPRPLPRMDYSKGIEADRATVVVIPTMLSNVDGAAELLRMLEVRYLGNRDSHLFFGLLTDFPDAAQETLPHDGALLEFVKEGVNQLNLKYASEGLDVFFLLHRPRLWNEQEGVWMGRERKRGKLADLNALLRGDGSQFSLIVGDATRLQSVRYVITLDTDTQLPRDAARAMAGAMAHPLNHPVFDPARRRVVAGYGILQPRVGVSLPSAYRSWFVRLSAGDSGIDPYTRVVSDVYQDLFGEGSFIGKGIYDVDAFEQTCGGFPSNTVLSHDLLESAFARSGLLIDVEVYEDSPAQYPVDVSRRHRWIRGDWQLLGWLLPRGGRRPHRARFSWLSWWKVADNLRRSVVPVALLLLLLCSWVMGDSILATYTGLLVLAVIGGVTTFASLMDLARVPSKLPFRSHLAIWTGTFGTRLSRMLLELVLLPYEAFISLDAIIRTLSRMCWSRRNLLEWKTSSDAERSAKRTLSGFFAAMWFSPAIALLGGLFVALFRPERMLSAAPFVALWLCAPAVAWWISRPLLERPVRLSEKQKRFLGRLARRTWRYFEVFVTAEENWLPPDNVQENPQRVANRTSPTNIGMGLLANLAAYDFGYCPATDLLRRTGQTLGTLERMERHRGHFFNWYDTRTLQPLPPRYVSTVDSGNLASNLLVLKSGLVELIDAPVLNPQWAVGLRQTADVLLEVARHQRYADGASHALLPAHALRSIEGLSHSRSSIRPGISAVSASLSQLRVAAAGIESGVAADPEVLWWTVACRQMCERHLEDLCEVYRWHALIPELQTAARLGGADRLRELHELLQRLDEVSSLRALAHDEAELLPRIDHLIAQSEQTHDLVSEDVCALLSRIRAAVVESSATASERIMIIEELAEQCHSLAQMDMSFLFDPSSELFRIGYNVDSRRSDVSFYDLLGSEARAASFVAIAQGQVSQEHWFALGRLLTAAGGEPALLSWSGSMFEYLMPLLIMPNYENTLLDHTYRAVVRRQIIYGRQRGVPWGISESGYNAFDVHLNYQYRAFGVPGLGLKRGLAEDLVVAPYATALALMIDPEAACRNLESLATSGQPGPFGFCEAIDFTPSRLPGNQRSVIVQQVMAHHQGMSFLSLVYVLLGRPMQRRFQADPMLKATDLLLQERIPKATTLVFPHVAEAAVTRAASAEELGTMRVFTDPSSGVPEVNLLSNGQYHVMLTAAGGGYSRWRNLAVTRWREDPTRDSWGTFCYVRDLDSGHFWSTTWQPAGFLPKRYKAVFTQARAEFRRYDHDIRTQTEVSVSPEDDIELRRITITNRSDRTRRIEITSYAEVVLAPQPNDQSHPAFSNLFVQTEFVESKRAILCTRRPRSAEERPPWMVHLLTVNGKTPDDPSFETDRMRFIGRNRTLASPVAMEARGALSGSHGPVLDPIVSIRQAVLLEPGESIRIDLVIGVAETRDAVTMLLQKYLDVRLADRVFELAWTRSQILLRQLNATESFAQLYARLAGFVIYCSSTLRADTGSLMRNRRGQSALWSYGISGDLPIVLVRIRERQRLDLVRHALQAHAFWRMKGLAVDLVIWNEDDTVYRQTLQDTIMDLLATSPEAATLDQPGGIFVRRGEQMSEEDRVLLKTVARIVLDDQLGPFEEQVERSPGGEATTPVFRPIRRRIEPPPLPEPAPRDLAFFNGTGGFSRDGREYVITLAEGRTTPAPWVNVIANAAFGTVVSEAGSVYTWSDNSHEFRITPWNNDPVTDVSGEAFYLRDEESGLFWSPTPLPARSSTSYVVRHGFGYSVFESATSGLETELTVFVATDAPVKVMKLKIRNRSGRARRISVTGYWEWVLGEARDKSLLHVVTKIDSTTGAIFARNSYNPEFSSRVGFADCSESPRSMTADRTEFLGRNGSAASPAAMRRSRLSGRVGAGLDSCAAIQTSLSLEDGQEREIVFVLGAALNDEEARRLCQRFRSVGGANAALSSVWEYWNRTLGVIHCETPDPAVNLLANGWLVYQVLSCRMWARTGFYQSGGAYGFRDQLQDAMALLHAEPKVLRDHLLRAAGRQFVEGDVEHWWHPPVGRGVRTKFSDDYLWLPYATCRYVLSTGDTGVLDEVAPFLTARQLRPEEESYYDLHGLSDQSASLFNHCVRAIDHGLNFGVHGLPLMGCGDWNDGMNLVGIHGRGESVWLAFFLYSVLTEFATLANERGESAIAERYTIEAGRLRGHIEEHGWDGDWYRRAYFDDGQVLGTASNDECQIDGIPQSWSIISGAGSHDRVRTAMESVDARLVRRDARLIQVLDPPFDRSSLNPGYIKGYVPGVRENGGQYTHASIWTAMAFAQIGDSERAWELFNLINPITHAETPEGVQKYRVEPYVVAADVYAVPPHTGRGGWTWYTGSAGWMYRLITESLLGLRLSVDELTFEPRMPAGWTSFRIHYRFRETFYHITVQRGDAPGQKILLDGVEQPSASVLLMNDRQDHVVVVSSGSVISQVAASVT